MLGGRGLVLVSLKSCMPKKLNTKMLFDAFGIADVFGEACGSTEVVQPAIGNGPLRIGEGPLVTCKWPRRTVSIVIALTLTSLTRTNSFKQCIDHHFRGKARLDPRTFDLLPLCLPRTTAPSTDIHTRMTGKNSC